MCCSVAAKFLHGVHGAAKAAVCGVELPVDLGVLYPALIAPKNLIRRSTHMLTPWHFQLSRSSRNSCQRLLSCVPP